MKKLTLAALTFLILSGCPKKVLEYKIDKIAKEINRYSIILSKDEISEESYVEIVNSLSQIYDSLCVKYDSLYER